MDSGNLNRTPNSGGRRLHPDEVTATHSYCICRSTDTSRFMIGCDNCNEWFHGECIGITEHESSAISTYFCKQCQETDPDLYIKYTQKKPNVEEEKKKRHHPFNKNQEKNPRRCGTCLACTREVDCGKCDFCGDMRKFGGPNKIRQKCRLRQCVNYGLLHSRKRSKARGKGSGTSTSGNTSESDSSFISASACSDFSFNGSSSSNASTASQQHKQQQKQQKMQQPHQHHLLQQQQQQQQLDEPEPGEIQLPIQLTSDPLWKYESDSTPGQNKKSHKKKNRNNTSNNSSNTVTTANCGISTINTTAAAAILLGAAATGGTNGENFDFKPQLPLQPLVTNSQQPQQQPTATVPSAMDQLPAAAAPAPPSTEAVPPAAGALPAAVAQAGIGEEGQCQGPNCQNAARADSKYCSEECGLHLAQARLFELLPPRIQQWQSSPCVAEENDKTRLEQIRNLQLEARKRLGEVDARRAELSALIHQAKNTPVMAEEEQENQEDEDMELVVTCVSCGMGTSGKVAIKHMEKCFQKFESRTSYSSMHKTKSGGESIFCEAFNPKERSYCKRLKVLCPEHAKPAKTSDGEVCGCPGVTSAFSDSQEYCRMPKKKCGRHYEWEKLRRAEIDMERVRTWIRLDELFEQERNIRIQMSQRAGVLGLMLHQTIPNASSVTSSA